MVYHWKTEQVNPQLKLAVVKDEIAFF